MSAAPQMGWAQFGALCQELSPRASEQVRVELLGREDAGVDPTVFHFAAQLGDVARLRGLLETVKTAEDRKFTVDSHAEFSRGSEVGISNNAEYEKLAGKREAGRMPLHFACASSEKGTAECVRLLLRAGAISSGKELGSGATPMHLLPLAAMDDVDLALEKMQLLLQWGAEVDAVDDGGFTTLHTACMSCTDGEVLQSICRALLGAGADANARDSPPTFAAASEGMTPLAHLAAGFAADVTAVDVATLLISTGGADAGLKCRFANILKGISPSDAPLLFIDEIAKSRGKFRLAKFLKPLRKKAVSRRRRALAMAKKKWLLQSSRCARFWQTLPTPTSHGKVLMLMTVSAVTAFVVLLVNDMPEYAGIAGGIAIISLLLIVVAGCGDMCRRTSEEEVLQPFVQRYTEEDGSSKTKGGEKIGGRRRKIVSDPTAVMPSPT
eukprot:g696.t1